MADQLQTVKRKIGLYFGSFNPIHVGHLIIANAVLQNGQLDRVRFVVSPQNPHKLKKDLLHEQDRLDMVRAAIYDNAFLEVTDLEFRLPKPSYTIDTLTYMQEKEPDKEFWLIMGGDNLQSFKRWKNWEAILEYFHVIVYPRPGATYQDDLSSHPKVNLVEAPLIDISATYIRKSIAVGKDVRYLVPQPVLDIIKGKSFYLD